MNETIERLKAEGLISLSSAAREISVHPASVSRWCRKGAKGRAGERVRLEHVRLPGRIVTSTAAVARFFAAIGEEGTPAAVVRTPAKRRQAVEDAGRTLDALGI